MNNSANVEPNGEPMGTPTPSGNLKIPLSNWQMFGWRHSLRRLSTSSTIFRGTPSSFSLSSNCCKVGAWGTRRNSALTSNEMMVDVLGGFTLFEIRSFKMRDLVYQFITVHDSISRLMVYNCLNPSIQAFREVVGWGWDERNNRSHWNALLMHFCQSIQFWSYRIRDQGSLFLFWGTEKMFTTVDGLPNPLHLDVEIKLWIQRRTTTL